MPDIQKKIYAVAAIVFLFGILSYFTTEKPVEKETEEELCTYYLSELRKYLITICLK